MVPLVHGSSTFLITPYYKDGDLLHFLPKCGRRMKYKLLSDIAKGMIILHGLNILHCDLKAKNILIGRSRSGQPVAKIADFGLAKVGVLVKDQFGKECIQFLGTCGATVNYAPPEWFNGTGLGKGSDVWSFAMLVYEVVSGGRPPYEFMDTPLVRSHGRKVQIRKSPFLPWLFSQGRNAVLSGQRPGRLHDDVEDGLWQLMERCWNQDQDKRPTFVETYAMLIKLVAEHR